MTKLSAFEYNGVDVAINVSNEQMSLTDLWKAAGSPANKDPRQWKRKEGKAFIKAVAKKLNVPEGHIIVSTRGKGGSTFGHWQVAMAYAKYANDDLHMHCNDIVRRYFSGDVSLAEEVIDRNNNPEDLKRIELRAKAKRTNKLLNSSIAAHGGDCYRVVANINNVAVTGKTAKELKAIRQVKQTRDGLNPLELTMLAAAEELESSGIEARAAFGNEAIVGIAKSVGDDISRLMHKYTR
ncbi:MAG TPA: KilA-N domain-containing protein [Coleofasciculaceae cyanobacterium]